MAVIEIVDELFGASSPDERRMFRAPLSIEAKAVTVRDLIRFRIEAEDERREDALARFVRSDDVATDAEGLNDAAVRARAFAGTKRRTVADTPPRTVEDRLDDAVHALCANAFMLFVDGQQVDDPDERVPLDTVHEALFLRLIPLQGG